MEIYFEQSINNPNIDKHQKRTSILKVVKVVLLVIAILLAFLFLFYFLPVTKGVFVIVMNVIFALMLVTPFALGYIFISRFLKKSNMEYDYLISGSVIRVVSVINRTKRKKLMETSISNIESIGRITSETYDRYASDKSVKKQFAICEFDDEDEIFYIYYIANGEKFLLYVSPNDEMILSLRRCVSRMSIIDKSVSLLAKKDKPDSMETANSSKKQL